MISDAVDFELNDRKRSSRREPDSSRRQSSHRKERYPSTADSDGVDFYMNDENRYSRRKLDSSRRQTSHRTERFPSTADSIINDLCNEITEDSSNPHNKKIPTTSRLKENPMRINEETMQPHNKTKKRSTKLHDLDMGYATTRANEKERSKKSVRIKEPTMEAKTNTKNRSTKVLGKDLESQIKELKNDIKNKSHQLDIQTSTTKETRQNGIHFCSHRRAKMTIIFLAYAIVITCLVGWLAQQYFRIPGLQTEINKLTQQVNQLKFEVDKFNGTVHRLEEQNDQLQEANSILETTKDGLQQENTVTQTLINDLNNTNNEFETLNNELQIENDKYFEYTQTLNVTVNQLVNDLAASTNSQNALIVALDDYKVIEENLKTKISSLSETTGDLNATVQELNDAIDEFEDENDRFRTIVSFLEVEANGVQQSYEELANALEDTIMRKRVLAEIAVEERMKAELAGWECGIVTAFGTFDFATNVDLPIGFQNYGDVINYANVKILSDLCIDSTDVESYLKNKILPQGASLLWTISLSDFTKGLNEYAAAALNYYFPDNGDSLGLSSETWESANYECTNLSQNDKFKYSS